jgi:hypothetical protein
MRQQRKWEEEIFEEIMVSLFLDGRNIENQA